LHPQWPAQTSKKWAKKWPWSFRGYFYTLESIYVKVLQC
jgi:hypothetical protein